MSQVGYATASGQQAAAKRPTEISSEISGLEKNIEELLSQVSLLEDRLSPVLAPLGPSEASTNSVPPDPSVPLASVICQAKRRVAAIGSRVASILDRIEL
jgi:hypothetical protein